MSFRGSGNPWKELRAVRNEPAHPTRLGLRGPTTTYARKN